MPSPCRSSTFPAEQEGRRGPGLGAACRPVRLEEQADRGSKTLGRGCGRTACHGNSDRDQPAESKHNQHMHGMPGALL